MVTKEKKMKPEVQVLKFNEKFINFSNTEIVNFKLFTSFSV